MFFPIDFLQKGKNTRSLSGPLIGLQALSRSKKIQVFWNFFEYSDSEKTRIFSNYFEFVASVFGLYPTDFGASFETEKASPPWVGSLTSFPLHFENLIHKWNSSRHWSSRCCM